ncbi:MAG: hypothetical protein B7X85_06575, partial [Thiotrichales bacterium 17-46-47]
FAQHQVSSIALQAVEPSAVHKYGIAGLNHGGEVAQLIEKPSIEQAPSNLAVLGRYLFTPSIFAELAQTQRGVGGEIQLTDAMHALLNKEKMRGVVFDGEVHDCGDKLGYLAATLTFAQRHPELGEAFKKMLKS